MRFATILMVAIFILTMSASAALAKPVRYVEAGPDDIVTIKTALGLSTLLELEGKPRSVIVGDQDSFRVEYAGKALAIKPLLPGSKSNLFVSQENDTYRFRLKTVHQNSADFVVRVKPKRTVPANVPATYGAVLLPSGDAPVSIAGLPKAVTKESIQLSVDAIQRQKHWNLITVNFHLVISPSVLGNRGLMLNPEDFHVFQRARDLPIERLSLSNSSLSQRVPVKGTFTISDRHVNSNVPITIAFSPGILGGMGDALMVTVRIAHNAITKGKRHENKRKASR